MPTPSTTPTVLVILGATGDLTHRKLMPALFRLYERGSLPKPLSIMGFSRRPLTTHQYQAMARQMLKAAGISGKTMEEFIALIHYSQGHFDQPAGYHRLAELLGLKNGTWTACSNRLFYLAVPPQYYDTIFRLLAGSGLTLPCAPGSGEGWMRIVVEKPFGRDLKTAQRLDATLGTLFREEQIYRIDHYLGKETVQNVLAFRFSNAFLEPAWNRDHIERVDLRFWETDGVETRGDFYDDIGALRDVGQNHLLQLLALFAMENPGAFDADSIRRERQKVLSTLKHPTKATIAKETLRGQYRGYRDVKGVGKKSATETYFRITTTLDTPRWDGVPFTLEGGKRLAEDRVEVAVTFKHHMPCLCPPMGGTHYRNVMRYSISPQEGIATSFWVKKPGTQMVIEERDFSFSYRGAYAPEAFVDAYEKLLLDALAGDQTLFVSTEEITASWRFIDPILNAWKRAHTGLIPYPAGSSAITMHAVNTADQKKKAPTLKKEIGIAGLGKMGSNMAKHLAEQGWRVVGFNRSPQAVEALKPNGIVAANDLNALVASLKPPRLVWFMVPAGDTLDTLLFGNGGIATLLKRGDIIVDGGNAYFKDSTRRGKKLKSLGIHFLDVGVSGGPAGARNGAALMVGGDRKIFHQLEPVFRDLAGDQGGYGYMGEAGAGHFVKMVHNGIEYGMMQSIAEGFALMRSAPMDLDLKAIAQVYRRGTVITSRLVDWLDSGFEEYGVDLDGVSGSVAATGEGAWTIKTAKELGMRLPAIEDAVRFRTRSQKNPSYTGKILSALRNQFGGHAIKHPKRP